MAKPIDPRLFKQAGKVRTLVVGLGLIAGVRAVAWVAIAFAIATLVVGARDGAPMDTRAVVVLAVALTIRPVLGYIAEQRARAQAAHTKDELRIKALRRSGLDPNQAQGQVAAMLTTGADALDEWFARFLPAALEGGIMPVVVTLTIALTDPISLGVLVVTVPLLGVFGWLIGVETRDQANRQYEAMTRLSGHFLDLLRGLETLRLFGVAKDQQDLVGRIADDLRTETMVTLRIAFLSALALELIAMIGTALIAVIIGIRLSYGYMELLPGLAVLIMAPEAYLPIRRVGATFHASTEGAAAGQHLLDAIGTPGDATPAPSGQARETNTITRPGTPEDGSDTTAGPRDPVGARTTDDTGYDLPVGEAITSHTPSEGSIQSDATADVLANQGTRRSLIPTTWAMDGVSVTRDGRLNLAPTSMSVTRGEYVVIAGQSGAGKSTLLRVLAGLITPTQGVVRINDLPVTFATQADDDSGHLGTPAQADPALGPHPVREAKGSPSETTTIATAEPTADSTALGDTHCPSGCAPVGMDPSYRAWMPQSPVVLATTLRDNITLGRPVDEATLHAVLAQCGASSFIDRLDEAVGQGGTPLSGGEVRRLGLARALVGRPVLLLADEPTAELDEGTAALVRATLRAIVSQGVGLVVASHDPEIIAAADTLIHLDPAPARRGRPASADNPEGDDTPTPQPTVVGGEEKDR